MAARVFNYLEFSFTIIADKGFYKGAVLLGKAGATLLNLAAMRAAMIGNKYIPSVGSCLRHLFFAHI